MPRPTFVRDNVIGGSTWAVGGAVAGYAAGAAYQQVAARMSHVSLVVVAVGATVVMVAHLLSLRRRGSRSTSLHQHHAQELVSR